MVRRVKRAHEEHMETLALVETELKSHNVSYHSAWRSQIDGKVDDVDLVISVGGDGTFLDASHALSQVPVLGVNSSCSSSFGHFCLANKDNFASCLEAILSGEAQPLEILRLELSINGTVIPELALNEVLIAHSSPAATSRYIIEVDGAREEHRSSGIWVSTPAGSTGSLRSAGGDVMPINEANFQYLVREACMRPGENWRKLKGVVKGGEVLKVISQMRTGEIYIDGPHIIYPLALGDELLVKASEHSLRAFMNADVNSIFSCAVH